MNVKGYAALLMCVLLTGCPDCSDPTGDGTLFEPVGFGEYEFDGAPDLDAPEYVLFGDVAVGDTGVQTIRVQNVGRERLKFNGWTVSEGFELEYLDHAETPTELRSGAFVDVAISFSPENDDEVRGDLVIESNDPVDPEWRIGLYANAKIPCLETDPKDVVDFGDVELEMEARKTVTFQSCSPNAITTFSLEPLRGDREFFLPNDEVVGEEISLQPFESIDVTVGFMPETRGTFRAFMDVASNSEFYPERTIDLVGVGTPGRCPEAIMTADHPERGSEIANPNGTFNAIPLDTIALSAMDSRAFDGRRVERFEWRLTKRPTDSSADFNLAEYDPMNSLFLDLAGEYVVELDVWDSEEIKSCEPARLRILAVANEDIHIQLVWDTPNDPNQLDASGSDVDIHLLHPQGEWNERPYDCFWQNLNPDWASERNRECATPQSSGCHDDPSLDIDDVDGWGPENINLDNPESGARYNVGVHYFSDHGYGHSFVSVRIFIGGVLKREFLRQRLEDQGFWYVGDIDWPSGAVTPNGTLYNGFPVE